MLIKIIWKKDCSLDEMHINANPKNKKTVESILHKLVKNKHLNLIHPVNNRSLKVDVQTIESIESYSSSSIVKLSNDKQEYIIQKRLKELEHLNQYGLFRVNNSVMVNISKIESFQVIGNARLEVITNDNQKYIVSRHYAKKIKEELLCSNN